MQPALPLTGNPVLLGRLASLYLGLFWALTALFYVSAFQAGYDTRLAMLSYTVAAIACVLLRFKEKHAADDLDSARLPWANPGTQRRVLAADQLVKQMKQARSHSSAASQMGLALISANVTEPERLDARVLAFVREYLFREAHSRVFEVDAKTLAIFERDLDIAARLASLSSSLQSEFRSLRLTTPALERHRLTVGVAIATDSKATAEQLLAKARSATKLADELKRDTFMRQV
ncbi:MAG TPA: hypothetical protein VJB57_00435 [Dehalococcoidia bacterium]|nr:hypothetical protein [Dehalococcoidia bacterium]